MAGFVCISAAEAGVPSPRPVAWLTPRSAKKQPRGLPATMKLSTSKASLPISSDPGAHAGGPGDGRDAGDLVEDACLWPRLARSTDSLDTPATRAHPSTRHPPPARLNRDDGHAGSVLLWSPGPHSRNILFADSLVAASEQGGRLRELGRCAQWVTRGFLCSPLDISSVRNAKSSHYESLNRTDLLVRKA